MDKSNTGLGRNAGNNGVGMRGEITSFVPPNYFVRFNSEERKW